MHGLELVVHASGFYEDDFPSYFYNAYAEHELYVSKGIDGLFVDHPRASYDFL